MKRSGLPRLTGLARRTRLRARSRKQERLYRQRRPPEEFAREAERLREENQKLRSGETHRALAEYANEMRAKGFRVEDERRNLKRQVYELERARRIEMMTCPLCGWQPAEIERLLRGSHPWSDEWHLKHEDNVRRRLVAHLRRKHGARS